MPTPTHERTVPLDLSEIVDMVKWEQRSDTAQGEQLRVVDRRPAGMPVRWLGGCARSGRVVGSA